MPRPASRCGCRDRHVSTTTRTPGTVSDDSASDVLTMMRGESPARRPRMTASCSVAGICPCSSRTSNPDARSRSRRAISVTSYAPGAKISTSADGSSRVRSRAADAAVRATWSRKSRVTPRSSSRGVGLGAQSSVSGCAGTVCSTIGAGEPSSPMTCAILAASRVADMATRVRPSRSWRASPSSPISRSVSSARSCTSSMTTASTPSSPGSSSIRRSSTPAVTNSMRVSALTWRSPRTVKPTRVPSALPSSCASRRAAARAATRRGWVTMTRPGERDASSGGTSVVLPVPGGALTTAEVLRSSAARRSSRAAANARPSPMAARSNGAGSIPPSSRAQTEGAASHACETAPRCQRTVSPRWVRPW